MEIKKYSELTEELQEELKKANVFFQPSFVDYVHRNNEELYFIYDNERVVPVRHRIKAIFNFGVFVSEPFIRVQKPSISESSFIDATVEKAVKGLHVQWLNSTAGCFFYETPTKNCKRIPFGSHVINLSLTEEELFKKVHSKHRNVIRKAEKEFVVIKRGKIDLLEDYALLERQTQNRTGRKASGLEYYEKQIKTLGDNIIVYIAYKDEVPQAGGVFYYNQQMCYYMYGATAQGAFIGSANLLIWTAIRDMKKKGVKEFSFVGCRINADEGSKYSGIQMFKGRFGGELRQGYMFRYERSPIMYKLFCKAMQWRTRNDKIYRDPIDEEIHKWKGIQV